MVNNLKLNDINDIDIEQNTNIINDFSIQVATPNGSGSQTSNLVLLRSLFKMGIPSSGKNLFPSNIQGMPTWYTIRCSQEGYVARRETIQIMVLMNPETALQDINNIQSGGVCLYPESAKYNFDREDITYYPMPVKRLAKESGVSSALRPYVSNMVYVGVLASVLSIDLLEIESALSWHFKGRQKLVDTNMPVIQAAFDWSRENLTKTDPFQVEHTNSTDGTIMVDGNFAAALGAIYGGVTVMAWYPITPSTSLADSLTEYARLLRHDTEGHATYSIIQAEDELAAAGMIMGAGWAGARAMTATSGPGISLMSEFAGFGYYAEIPAVIWDVQRVGPSTGLPTRVSQGDLTACHWSSHGDTEHICLLPGNVSECFEFGWRAFDIAEQYQTPVFVLSDLDLGMNNWMTKPFNYPDKPMNRGKVLTADQVNENGFKRYFDLDGDGIPYRTLPGTVANGASYFTRGSGHDESAKYSEDPQDYANNMSRLRRKIDSSRETLPAPIVEHNKTASIGFVGFGSTDPAIIEARDRLAVIGVASSYLRVRALPASLTVSDFIASHERVYVVEMNIDGQLHKLIQIQSPELATKVLSLAHCDGLPLTASWIVSQILEQERGPNGKIKD
ncbi:MAG: 2-oxoacid:acceptor oxidoreductase subunit alpha [Anaerolineales bacterium]